MGTLGQLMRKINVAIRLTMAHAMQNRMMPLQRKFSLFTMYPPRKVPPPPAGTTMYPSKVKSRIRIDKTILQRKMHLFMLFMCLADAFTQSDLQFITYRACCDLWGKPEYPRKPTHAWGEHATPRRKAAAEFRTCDLRVARQQC
uniref:Uncharacterized protein n=1 Tax=Nothobranchius furzeri TaxID=105023 RepID=A0A8C6P245_NOTFU